MTPVAILLPMVEACARRFHGRVYNACDREDLFQEGVVGLLEAASRYETGRNCRLATFGAHRMSGAMMDHVRSLARRSVECACADPEARPPRDLDITRSMESRAMLRQLRRVLVSGLPGLDATALEVLRLRFRDGLTAREAATRLGVSAPTIVRLEAKALARIRDLFQAGSEGG